MVIEIMTNKEVIFERRKKGMYNLILEDINGEHLVINICKPELKETKQRRFNVGIMDNNLSDYTKKHFECRKKELNNYDMTII